MLTSIVGMIVLLGGLIFFHEFGHYSIAKLFGIKVEVFSLGFGKKIFQKKWGETEYCLSIFPFGGYVKLMGDDPYKGVPAADAERAFSTQKLYKRFLVVFAGPFFNLMLAFGLMATVFWFGQPAASTKVGTVMLGTPSYEAGLRPRDRILAVNGEKVEAWIQFEEKLRPLEGKTAELLIQREKTDLKLTVPVTRVRAKNAYGEDEEVGGLKGISPLPLASVVGVSNSKSPAYIAGLRTGDLVTKVNTHSVGTYEELKDAFAAEWEPKKALVISVKRKAADKAPEADMTFNLSVPEKAKAGEKVGPFGYPEQLGMLPSELFVDKVGPGSPAEKGGLQPGDRIVRVNKKDILNFETIIDEVQATGSQNAVATFEVEREGQPVVLTLNPTPSTQEDPMTRQPVKRFMVGFVPRSVYQDSEVVKLTTKDPIALVSKAAHETYDIAYKMVVSLVKLAAGQISVKNLGGPVLIATVAGKSLDAGIIPFLQMMALISINLFLLNLFPVPVLDGGHLLFFIIEGIKGRPVSIRTMEVANQVGMVFILFLVGLTLFNDISRILIH